MNDRQQLEEWGDQPEKNTRQYGGRVQRTAAAREGTRKVWEEGGGGSHVKIITQTQTLTQHFF